MGLTSIWHWLIVLIVVLLIFGTKKLRNIGEDLGGAIKGFKEGMKSEEEKQTENQPLSKDEKTVIEGEVTKKDKS